MVDLINGDHVFFVGQEVLVIETGTEGYNPGLALVEFLEGDQKVLWVPVSDLKTHAGNYDFPNPVTKPAHYTFGKYEVLDVILDWGLNFTRGSAVKYIARAGRKSKDTEAQDLRKAAQVLLREADILEGKNE